MSVFFSKYFFIWSLAFLLPIGGWSQNLETLKRDGDEQFRVGNFAAALFSYNEYEAQKPGNVEILTGIGASHFEIGNLIKATRSFNRIIQSGKRPTAETWRYYGKTYHARLQFEKAIDCYKSFLREAEKSHPYRPAVKEDILRCKNGILIGRQESEATVVNLGEPLNSPNDEFKPLPALEGSRRLYFAVAKAGSDEQPMQSDLYLSDLNQGDWLLPQPVSPFLNSADQNEVPQGINEKGTLLYFFRGKTLFSGENLVDTLRANKLDGLLNVPEFISPAHAWEGDCGLFFFTDSILLFASRRPGGYGGLDLYVATLHPNGWSTPENLGPVINTAYDETSPFLAGDGRTLYYSTNNARKSIGGLDIVKSVFLDRVQRWTPPENLGIPFNSAGDDEHFFLTTDGSRAFFSSSRKQGLGLRDLYVGIFEKKNAAQLQRSKPMAFHFVTPPNEASYNSTPKPSTLTTGTLRLTPLHYPEPNMPLTEASFSKLKEVAGWMKKHPELRVTFAAHAAPDDQRSISQAALQQVVEVLQGEGVSLKNITLRNIGPAFPLPENDDQLNRRVDILLANPEVLPLQVELPEVSSSKAFFFQKAMGRLVYQVKISLEENLSPEVFFQHYPDGTLIELPATGEKSFVHGIFLTWDSALEAQRDFEKNGFSQARALPYLKGWELSKIEAQSLLEEYPDLANFAKP